MRSRTTLGLVLAALVVTVCMFLSVPSVGYAREWEDSRWKTHWGRDEAVDEAVSQLYGFGFFSCLDNGKWGDWEIHYEVRRRFRPWEWFTQSEHLEGQNLFAEVSLETNEINFAKGYYGVYADGTPKPVLELEEAVDMYALIYPDVFDQGFLDVDPDNLTLWDKTGSQETDDVYHVHYEYAYDLIEALQFIVFVEIGHTQFATDKECQQYAREMILAIRQYHAGRTYVFIPVGWRALAIAQGQQDPQYPFDPFGEFSCQIGQTTPQGPPPSRPESRR